MAHVVGVPRRDPCQKCQLPVFLAERLTVGKKVYHRTCLKCARCGSQLTPGSFYETEVDDVFCCETCPDEEEIGADGAATGSVMLRQTVPHVINDEAATSSSTALGSTTDVTLGSRAAPVRSSIADRLAFFEKSKTGSNETAAVSAAGNKLLQKSVSDEEKSKSLQRMEANAAAAQPYKMNSAFSSFLNDTVVDGGADSEQDESEHSGANVATNTEDKTESQMDTTDTEEQETEDDLSLEQTPELPSTKPPTVVETQILDAKELTPSKRFTATAQMILGAEDVADSDDQPKDNLIISNDNTEILDDEQLNLTTTRTNDNANNNGYQLPTATSIVNESHKITQESKHLDLSQTNDNDCITKDKTAVANRETAVAQPHYSPSTDEMKIEIPTDNVSTEASVETAEMRIKFNDGLKPEEDVATTERLSVVRARLQQFEVITNNNTAEQADNKTAIDNNININSVNHDKFNETVATPKSMSQQAEENLEDEAKLKAKQNEKLEEDIETVEMNREETETVQSGAINMEADISIVANETALNIEMVEEMKADESKISFQLDELETVKIPTPEPRLREVPSVIETKDNEMPEITEMTEMPKVNKIEEITTEQTDSVEDEQLLEDKVELRKTSTMSNKVDIAQDNEKYPEDLNPFASDDDDDDEAAQTPDSNKENISKSNNISSISLKSAEKSQHSLNPFDSSDDEVELLKSKSSTATKVPPPRPPPPRISRNPFGDEDSDNFSRRSSLNSSLKKTPVPTPRTNLSQSQNPTPEPTPRLSAKTPQTHSPLQNVSDYYGSVNSLSTTTPLQRNSDLRGSNQSLASSAGGTIRSRKSRKAPAPPTFPPPVKELFPSTETISSSKTSTPSSSTVGTPKSGRKKRLAPAPPKPARLDPAAVFTIPQINLDHGDHTTTASKNLLNYPLQSELDSKLSDEEKALLEGKQLSCNESLDTTIGRRNSHRLIPLDPSLLEDANNDTGKCDDLKYKQSVVEADHELSVVYRRVLIPPLLETPTHDTNPLLDELNAAHDRQLEKLKDNKEAQNRNRQSQVSASSGAEDSDPATLYNKSSHGKWKRRKGPAPALPIPPRKVLQMLPLQEIRHELDIIEVQQQGLEKQGVILEKMIRDRCEGQNGELLGGSIRKDAGGDSGDGKAVPESVQNSKEVEDLILQLFELVNEKNELFRRQAELMYLRRQHRLEQEQADLEYEIRVLMAQPERNKTDSDKAREEALIARLVEVVQLRNEVVECLEMDRLREAEEDLSIKQRLELHTAKRDSDDERQKTLTKLSKKEKKKQKESKKLSKSKKIDADKDADESELNADKLKLKKKKKKFLLAF